MHIIETYFECGGFDHRMIQGGTSVYLWNLARSLARHGERVSIVTPAHGRLDELRRYHDVLELDYRDVYRLPIRLDRRIWGEGFADEVGMNLTTTAHRMSLDGVDLYFLSNEVLDQLPDRFYPSYETKGRDLVFFKPLVYQVDAIRFIRARFPQRSIVHAHEPFYHYLMPGAFRDDQSKLMVSTVQSNMPVTKSVYRPEVETLFAFLGVQADVPAHDPEPPADLTVQSCYQQLTHLHYEYPRDYVRIYDLVAEYADLVGFLSEGHQRFLADLADTPFEQVFRELPIAATVRRNAHKHFVAGCAIGDDWIAAEKDGVDRDQVLTRLGLDPRLPTFYHNARLAVQHKGQVELFRAIDRVLEAGEPANFIIRCLSDAPLDPRFIDVGRRHQGRIHLETARVDDRVLMGYAASSEFCLFPSKFEMDTFLIAQGEAMARGAVPVATAQLGMAHFRHVTDPTHGPDRATATGFAVGRSFAEDDEALVTALADRIHTAVRLWYDEPHEYARLSANAMATAGTFTWDLCARRHLDAFTMLWSGERPALPIARILDHGWFDMLDHDAWSEYADDIAEAAIRWGDVAAFRLCRELDTQAAITMFDAAWQRADMPACVAIAGEVRELEARLRNRYDLDEHGIRYRMPQAARVDLVSVDTSATGGRRRPKVVPLFRRDGEFRLRERPSGRLHLLLTLPDGRCAWDVIDCD